MCKTGGVTILPLGEARNHLSEVIDAVDRTHERVTITRHGQPIAVVISPEELAGLEETIEILSTPGAVSAISAGVAALDRGDLEDWAQLRAEFGRAD